MFHIHGNYKQGIQDEADPNLGKSETLNRSWQVEICTQVNVIPLNTKLPCYNIVEKATLIMSKIMKLV